MWNEKECLLKKSTNGKKIEYFLREPINIFTTRDILKMKNFFFSNRNKKKESCTNKKKKIGSREHLKQTKLINYFY